MDTVGQANIGSIALLDQLLFTDPSAVEQISGLPKDFSLSQNYPNPFNPSTKIEYSLSEQSLVQLKVYDILGNEVASLLMKSNQQELIGQILMVRRLSSGLYIAKLQAGNYTKTIKMSLLK